MSSSVESISGASKFFCMMEQRFWVPYWSSRQGFLYAASTTIFITGHFGTESLQRALLHLPAVADLELPLRNFRSLLLVNALPSLLFLSQLQVSYIVARMASVRILRRNQRQVGTRGYSVQGEVCGERPFRIAHCICQIAKISAALRKRVLDQIAGRSCLVKKRVLRFAHVSRWRHLRKHFTK